MIEQKNLDYENHPKYKRLRQKTWDRIDELNQMPEFEGIFDEMGI